MTFIDVTSHPYGTIKAFLKKKTKIDGVILKCSYIGNFENKPTKIIQATYPCINFIGKYKDTILVSMVIKMPWKEDNHNSQ